VTLVHVDSKSPILYFGTPVVLVSTINDDGRPNLAPMSSAWWLGWRCMLGLASISKTTENLRRTGECVLNLPSAEQVGAVDRIARTTGSDPVPAGKRRRGYVHEGDKFARAGLTPIPSLEVAAPRAAECPIQLEARVSAIHRLANDDATFDGFALAIEVAVQRLHVDESLLMDGNPDRIDSAKWRPLIMSFQEFYGLEDGRLHPSRLGEIPERLYPRAGAG
jgi:flavin reductase (DIM6/NTAB) family NADH-FMN oxidoreductase RutF